MNQSMVEQKRPTGDSFNFLQVMGDDDNRLPCFNKGCNASRQRFLNAVSPTAIDSSTISMSGSILIAIENPSLTYIPDE